ncbi:oligosaccharyl transferase, STT3 subunit [Pyrococcus kukulkanii]|uniref:oligosaccharyl transferase, STT3 subunit n=1 Tax=Pyrococcus kukulkanii TaxID=1609559 RepID=UPI00356B5CF1
MKVKYKYMVILGIVSALIVRLIPLRMKYMYGYDPYFHLKYILYCVEKEQWVNFFPYALGPWGMKVRLFHPLGLWATPAYLSKILPGSIDFIFKITPVIFGVLTIIFFTYALSRVYGYRTAALFSLLLAFNFGHIMRSMANYYRGDNYMLFWYSLAFFGFSLLVSPRNTLERITAYFLIFLSPALASVFWQAYYPIFVLVLANAVFLLIGAFLLSKDGVIPQALIAIGLMLPSTVLASVLGEKVGFGMLGENKGMGNYLSKKFGLEFGFLHDIFLYYLFKIILLVVLLAVIILIVSKLLRDIKTRAITLTILVIAGSLILYSKYYPIFSTLLNRIFLTPPISETQRSTLRDFWIAYGPQFLLAFLYPLRFRRLNVFTLLTLGTVLVLLPMAIIWTRFLFLASVAISLMATLGLSSFKLSKRKIVASTLVVAISISSVHGTYETLNLEPEMNEYWENALVWLGRNSNINDIVLVWWDYGHWVTYYSTRAPVAQGSPSKFVARYYLGLVNNRSLMNIGVDYVIVSYNLLYKFQAVVKTANVTGYRLLLLHKSKEYTFTNGDIAIVAVPTRNSWDVRIIANGIVGRPREAYVEVGDRIYKVKYNSNADLYVYVNFNYGYAVLTDSKTFNTPMVRMMATNSYPGYELVYSDGGIVKIFKFNHPNVVVKGSNGRIVLRFSAPVKAKLRLYGYLDNGTLVYKETFDVKGKDSFFIPQDLNNSVVIRYVYFGKYVFDRGLFRVDDILRSELSLNPLGYFSSLNRTGK